MNPLISVLIQTYNHEEYIADCINSILSQQTDYSIEIIIGEDGSNDNTKTICSEYQKLHPDKIRLFFRSRKNVIHINGSPTGRSNLIENLKEARGEYIALCEGDDYWVDNYKLQKQIEFLIKNNQYSACSCRSLQLHQNDKSIIPFRIKYKQTYCSQDLLTPLVPFHTSSFVFRKNAFLDYDSLWFKQVKIGDHPLFFAVSLKGDIKHLNFTGSVYRKHSSGITNSNLHARLVYDINRIETWSIIKNHLLAINSDSNIPKKINILISRHRVLHLFRKLYINFPIRLQNLIKNITTYTSL